MRYAEINKKYTKIISEYIGKGYVINTGSMDGNQFGGGRSDIARVDLTNGIEIVRVLLEDFHNYGTEIRGVEITVGLLPRNIKPNEDSCNDTIFNSSLEILHRETFYEIGENYYGSEEDAAAAVEIRCERRRNKYDGPYFLELNEKKLELAERVIRKKLGLKRIVKSRIMIRKADHGYAVTHNGNLCYLR